MMNKTLIGAVGVAAMVACSGRTGNRAVISAVAPTYPPAALAMKVGGEVRVSVHVDEGGHVMEASAVSGNVLLEEASISAAKEWRFATAFRPSTETLVFGYEWFEAGSPFQARTIFVQPNQMTVRAESVASKVSH
jgi:TonB family protein